MNKHQEIDRKQVELKGVEFKIGESIEQKLRRALETNAPIEAISPMIYTERKDGVKPETNIRTDKWEIAQQAMTTIATGSRQKRQERVDKQAAESK